MSRKDSGRLGLRLRKRATSGWKRARAENRLFIGADHDG
jgi:hypothetical protein